VNVDFDLKKLQLPPEQEVKPSWTPKRITKRRQHFIMVPFDWLERLNGASGQVHTLALHLLYLRWKGKGAPVKLPNGMLKIDGINRRAKWRALAELEHRGLISIERRPGKSPLVRVAST
jgi:hypothetical protein